MYEESTSAVTTALTNSSKDVFNAATIQSILSLTTKTGDAKVRIDELVADANGNVNVSAGAEVVMIKSSDSAKTTITAPKDAPVIIFQGKGGVIATINDGATVVDKAAGIVERVVVGTAGADRIVIADGKNSQVIIGQGDTVVAGAGADTIVAGAGNSTVQGGTGYAIVKLGGDEDDYNVSVVGGHAVVKNLSSGNTTDISKIQFVQLDNGDALIFAKNAAEAAVAQLYEATFGRAADANGLDYWFDLANAGVSLDTIADGFVASNEYKAMASVNDLQFINNVYSNTFGHAASVEDAVRWTMELAAGKVDRADVLASVTALAAQHLDGHGSGEATIVGSITIIGTII
ncbi:MAG: DUF4214 domain-containing protein [Telluria sp.]